MIMKSMFWNNAGTFSRYSIKDESVVIRYGKVYSWKVRAHVPLHRTGERNKGNRNTQEG